MEEGCDWLAAQNHAELGKAVPPEDGLGEAVSQEGGNGLAARNNRQQVLMAPHCPQDEIQAC